MNRYRDWFRQAEADLAHARSAQQSGHHEWSCFSAHQAGEKAIKAVFWRHGKDAPGHTLTALIGKLPGGIEVPADLIEDCKALDKHYIPTRYPNGFDSGAPTDFYTASEAETAVAQAEAIIEFCRRQID